MHRDRPAHDLALVVPVLDDRAAQERAALGRARQRGERRKKVAVAHLALLDVGRVHRVGVGAFLLEEHRVLDCVANARIGVLRSRGVLARVATCDEVLVPSVGFGALGPRPGGRVARRPGGRGRTGGRVLPIELRVVSPCGNELGAFGHVRLCSSQADCLAPYRSGPNGGCVKASVKTGRSVDTLDRALRISVATPIRLRVRQDGAATADVTTPGYLARIPGPLPLTLTPFA